MKSNYTHIVAILDRSGSMSNSWQDAVGGMRTFIAEQKAQPGEATLTLVGFDHEYALLHDFTPIAEVPDDPLAGLAPRGNTAYLDALGRSIASAGEKLAAMSEEGRPEKVIVVVMTDGQENASREYQRDQIRKMIATQEGEFGWSFVFLASDASALADAQNIGIKSSFAYAAAAPGDTVRGLSSYTSSLRSSGGDDVDASQFFGADKH